MTIDDVRNVLLNSNEALNIRLSDPTKKAIDELYVEIFQKHADEDTLNYYFMQLGNRTMTMEDIKKDLLAKKDG